MNDNITIKKNVSKNNLQNFLSHLFNHVKKKVNFIKPFRFENKNRNVPKSLP